MDRRNPFREPTAWRDWLGALVITVVTGGLALWALAGATRHGDLSAVFETRERDSTPARGDAEPLRLPAMAVEGSATSGTVVYTCERNGVRAYSDRPCAADAEITTLDSARLNTYTAPPIDRFASPAATTAAASSAAPAPDEWQRPDAACRSLEAQIERIDARMRAGYGAEEGEWLRSRRHALKEQHHAIGCTWRTP